METYQKNKIQNLVLLICGCLMYDDLSGIKCRDILNTLMETVETFMPLVTIYMYNIISLLTYFNTALLRVYEFYY